MVRSSLTTPARNPMTKDEVPLVGVIHLRPLEGHKLWLRFTDGSEGIRDLSDIIAHEGPLIEPLRDPAYFKRIFIEMGVPTWPNGFDLVQLRDAGALSRAAAE